MFLFGTIFLLEIAFSSDIFLLYFGTMLMIAELSLSLLFLSSLSILVLFSNFAFVFINFPKSLWILFLSLKVFFLLLSNSGPGDILLPLSLEAN